MNEIRAEQTNINTNPQRHTHTRTDGEGTRKISRKNETEKRHSRGVEQKGKKETPKSYKQVKSEIASLASQHRGW